VNQLLCDSEFYIDPRRGVSADYAEILDLEAATGMAAGATGWHSSEFSASAIRRRRICLRVLWKWSSRPRCERSSITSRAYRRSDRWAGFGQSNISPNLNICQAGPREEIEAVENIS